MANHWHDNIFNSVLVHIGFCYVYHWLQNLSSLRVSWLFIFGLFSCGGTVLLIDKVVLFFNQVSKLSPDDKISDEHFAPKASESFTNSLVPDVRLITMDVDEPCVPCDVLKGVVVADWLFFQHHKDCFFQAISAVEQRYRLLNIKVFKDLL